MNYYKNRIFELQEKLQLTIAGAGAERLGGMRKPAAQEDHQHPANTHFDLLQ